jgi:hypothetical protein
VWELVEGESFPSEGPRRPRLRQRHPRHRPRRVGLDSGRHLLHGHARPRHAPPRRERSGRPRRASRRAGRRPARGRTSSTVYGAARSAIPADSGTSRRSRWAERAPPACSPPSDAPKRPRAPTPCCSRSASGTRPEIPTPPRHGADTRPVDLPLPDTSPLNVTDPSRLDLDGSPDAVGIAPRPHAPRLARHRRRGQQRPRRRPEPRTPRGGSASVGARLGRRGARRARQRPRPRGAAARRDAVPARREPARCCRPPRPICSDSV